MNDIYSELALRQIETMYHWHRPLLAELVAAIEEREYQYSDFNGGLLDQFGMWFFVDGKVTFCSTYWGMIAMAGEVYTNE